MPGSKRISKSVRRDTATDTEGADGVEERKNFLVNDPETGIQKEIRPRLRSGANARDNVVNASSEEAKSLADQHAKRLRVAKSSRISITDSHQKPPRAGAPVVDFTLSTKKGDFDNNGSK